MAILSHFRREPGTLQQHGVRRAGGGLLLPPLLLLMVLMLVAVAYIVYILWPSWPGAPVALDAPELPITIAGVAFDVPPAAIRVPVQRRPGAHDRIDLAFMWPSLKPADPAARPAAPAALAATGALPALDRIFITIAGAGDAMAPAERVRTIYPRYASSSGIRPDWPAVLAFRKERLTRARSDLRCGDAENFLVRCTTQRRRRNAWHLSLQNGASRRRPTWWCAFRASGSGLGDAGGEHRRAINATCGVRSRAVPRWVPLVPAAARLSRRGQDVGIVPDR